MAGLRRNLASEGTIGPISVVAWVLLAGVWLYFAWLPLTINSQMWLGWGLTLGLLILRRIPNRKIWFRLMFLCMAMFLTARYIIWRSLDTLSFPDYFSMAVGLVLFIAEVYGFILHGLGIFVNMWPVYRASTSLPADPKDWPSVDVMIPTYNEDLELLETTIRAALNIRYPRDKFKVFLLDDGGTAQKRNDVDRLKSSAAQKRHVELSDLCARLGAHYMTRERNEHAKAGNINAAFKRTNGQLILVIDADHVPTVDILERTVGEFCVNPKLFLVQTPHFFVNPDPIERNLRIFESIPGENEMLFQVIHHGLDFWNSSFFCGSAAVLRRAALDEIGGFSGESVTEDAETALILHARGWQSSYIDHPMTSGLQAETLSGFVLQRSRWAQGMLQILLLKNPLRLKGLKWWQRLTYFNNSFYWLYPFARLMYVLSPSAYLVFGLKIYNVNILQALAFTMPHMISTSIASDFMYGRARWPFVSELYEVASSLYVMPAMLATLMNPRAPNFKVTPKGERLDENFTSQLTSPFFVLYVLSLISIAMGIWRWHADPFHHDAVIITMAWELFGFLFLNGVLGIMFEKRQTRGSPRIPINIRAQLSDGQSVWDVKILDLSVTGVKVSSAEGLAGHGHMEISMENPLGGSDIKIPVSLTRQGNQEVAFRFSPQTEADRNALVLLSRGSSDRWAEIRTKRQMQPHRGFRASWFLLRVGLVAAAHHWRHILMRGLFQPALRFGSMFLVPMKFMAKEFVAMWHWITARPRPYSPQSTT